jgi:hypothetical protein
MYGAGRRALCELQVQVPSWKFISEKFGFAGLGMGVLSIVGELAPRAIAVVAQTTNASAPNM